MVETSQAKPALQRLFEAAAVAMDLDVGQQRLELIFVDGQLQQFWSHHEKQPPGVLHRYDGRLGWTVTEGEGAGADENLRRRLIDRPG